VHNHKMAPKVPQPTLEPAWHSSSFTEHRLGVSVKSQGHSPFHAIKCVRELDVDAQGRPRSWDVPAECPVSWDVPEYRPIPWDLPAGRPTSWDVPEERPISWDLPFTRAVSTSPARRGVDAQLFFKRIASAPSSSTAGRVSSSKTLKPLRTASERGAFNYVKEQKSLMESARALSMSLKEGGREGEMARTPSMSLKAHRPVESKEGGKSPYERDIPVQGGKSAQLAVFLSVESWGSSCHEGSARYGEFSPL